MLITQNLENNVLFDKFLVVLISDSDSPSGKTTLTRSLPSCKSNEITFLSIPSPGMITGMPGGQGQAISAQIRPRALCSGTVSVGRNSAFLGIIKALGIHKTFSVTSLLHSSVRAFLLSASTASVEKSHLTVNAFNAAVRRAKADSQRIAAAFRL